MGYAHQQFETGSTLEQLVDLAEVTTDQDESANEAFNEEIDTWARRALAANGFGDY